MELALPIILGIINGSFNLLANHLGKPEGWVPSPQEWTDLNDLVSKATPENVRAEARARLGLPPVDEGQPS